MPELPEVETIRRGLGGLILNKKIVRTEVKYEKSFIGVTEVVDGATVIDLRRRGKALLIDLDNGVTLMVHLRMTGQLIWRGSSSSDSARNEPTLPSDGSGVDAAHVNFAAGHPSKNFIDVLPNTQTRVIFEFEDGKLFFNDQRKFGFIKLLATDEIEQDKFIASLAKEPWSMSEQELYAQCQRHARAPIKAVLLDQKVIAGLGNIYADETLFYAGVHPETLAGELAEETVAKLLEGACQTMQVSIDSGGSTMATYLKPDGTTGSYLERFAQVFRRDGQPCPRCGTEIIKTRVAGRGTHLCPHCQRRQEGTSPEQRVSRSKPGQSTDRAVLNCPERPSGGSRSLC